LYGDWGLGIGDWAQSPIPNPQIYFLQLLFIINFTNITNLQNNIKQLTVIIRNQSSNNNKYGNYELHKMLQNK